VPFPAGVLTRSVVLPQITDSSGVPVSGVMTITPSLTLKWGSTEQVVLRDPISVNIIDGTAIVLLPIVQTGFFLTNNIRVDAWTYRVTLSLPVGGVDISDIEFVLVAGEGDFQLNMLAPADVPSSVITQIEGAPGPSAYEIAVSEGFLGNEEQWLASLIGPSGTGGGTVFYGNDPDVERPVSPHPIMWIGDTGVVPLNAVENDMIFTADPGVEPDPSDTTPPTVGTMTASAVTDTGFTLTVTGASDETALAATPYGFSLNDGATWTPYQASAVYSPEGLTPDTEYTTRHRVRDNAGNVSTGPPLAVSTDAAPLVGNFFTFGSDTIGVPPAGWATPWSGTGLSWEVAADGAAVGGKVLQIGGTDTTRKAYIWSGSGAGADADVEVLWKFKFGTIGVLRALLRASGSSPSETGIYLILSSGSIQGGGLVAGSIVPGGFGTASITAGVSGTWNYMRARAIGDQLSLKVWYGTNPEPGTWAGTLTIPAGLLAAGDVGLYNIVNDPLDYTVDWISVASGGDTAVNPED